MHIGMSNMLCSDWTKEDWGKVEVLLKCGTGKDASSKQELQVNILQRYSFLANHMATLIRYVNVSSIFTTLYLAGHLATPDKPQVDTFCISWSREAPFPRSYQEQGAGDKCQGRCCLVLLCGCCGQKVAGLEQDTRH